MMGRREFITLLGSAAAAWPLAARAQQPERMRRIGVLLSTAAESDPDEQFRLDRVPEWLPALGWTQARNFQIDIRKVAISTLCR